LNREEEAMTERIRVLLAIEVVVFASAALIHAGWPLADREDIGAATAESVIALVLLAGLTLTWLRPTATRAAAIAAQGFALLGTCVGLTLVIFVGPTNGLDLTIHSIMLALLVSGLVVTVGRARNQPTVAVR
jgi:peptidoglycan/LPS O-acetylase OafA/YrhL